MGTAVSKQEKFKTNSPLAADVRQSQRENENYILVMQTVKCPSSQPIEDLDGDFPADDDSEDAANKTIAVAFSWAHGGSDVFLCGSFSKWRRIPMTKSGRNFTTIVHLPEGKHEYKYIVDEQWRHNPEEECMFNSFRTLNNVVTVAETHIEKFDETLDESFREDGISFSSLPMDGDDKLSPCQIAADCSSLLQFNMRSRSVEDPIVLSEAGQILASPIKGGVPKVDSLNCFREKYVLSIMYEQV